MALVRDITKQIEIPGEGVPVVIRKLSHKQLKAAAKKRQSEGIDFMKEMGPELLKAMREADTAKEVTDQVNKIEEAVAASVNNYDRDVLLSEGVASWGYPVEPKDGLDMLDEPTAAFIANEVFAFSRPATEPEKKA